MKYLVRMSSASVLVLGLTSAASAAKAISLFAPIPATIPTPQDNPSTPARIELGKQLYFDPRLSAAGNLSCNSCHNVMAGGDDNSAFSTGHKGQLGGRSAPTVWNAALMSVQFWDGRASSLEEQAKGPLINPLEMAMDNHDVVVGRIRQIPGYVATFKAVFGESGGDPVTIDNAVKAIAAFERTLVTRNSPVDRFLAGDKQALSKTAQEGFKLVQEIGCAACHSGANFAGPALPMGTGFYQKFPVFPGTVYEAKYKLSEDLGRFAVTKSEADKNMWRVPTWRNVALTAPYFHNGSVPTLDEAVRVMAKTQLNRDLSDKEATAIVAFLSGLTGEFPAIAMPRLPSTPGASVLGAPRKGSSAH